MDQDATPVHQVAAFHPALAGWFTARFSAPTEAQARAWAAQRSGCDVLVAAPTGSGKTLAAFLAAIDDLLRQGLAGMLPDAPQVLYVSPLKALSNDIQRNLEQPLAGIRSELGRMGLPAVDIRTAVRSGDTPSAERSRMARKPPHIIVTTPESFYILLGSDSGRRLLATIKTVIVDEIHALAPSKRGAHLALSLARLDALVPQPARRIGLSATCNPIGALAEFLCRAGTAERCAIIDTGHQRRRDLALELPPVSLEAVMSNDAWQLIYRRIAELIEGHRTTLVFVNTRRLAERLAHHLSERLGKDRVSAHHGSLARELRLAAEQRLARGELRALVATASLELGIDVGEVDLVCQIGSPRSVAALLQRVGRSGHAVGRVPKGRLFPLSRDDLVECAALLDCVRRGELDRLRLPRHPLDVLAQQVAAEVACGERGEDELFDLVRVAQPYRDLLRTDFDAVVERLAEGFATRFGRRGALLHRDAVNHRLAARRGTRLLAIASGGTIADTADYDVLLEPEEVRVGSVHEDFAVESIPGDVFQLGNASYRIRRVEPGKLRVEDAQGAAPTIPFWLGEAPARADVVSTAVARLRAELEPRLVQGIDHACAWLVELIGLGADAAEQIAHYLSAGRTALGVMPTQSTVVVERFFDESGGMQLVIHSPFGARINRAWGLALRKRFCRRFNFELQAAAVEDAIVLSLSSSHSFALSEVASYLNAKTARDVLVQALLDAPMFGTRWRWNATVALALPRQRGGKRVALPLQRMLAQDLLAAVFPDQVACAENLTGEREIPNDPLVQQTLRDCLEDVMDVDGLIKLLGAVAAGTVRMHNIDTTEPSPLAAEVLGARPYAFLDDAPLEERRTQAVTSRRWLDAAQASELGRLDPSAIERVRAEVWPQATSANELHDALLQLGALAEPQWQAEWADDLGQLAAAGRATCAATGARRWWVSAERLPEFAAVVPNLTLAPPIDAPARYADKRWDAGDALRELLRGYLQCVGPCTAAALANTFGVTSDAVDLALTALEVEGFALRGNFTGAPGAVEWCERRLLARIHRYTVDRLRREIEPVSAADFMRHLSRWQHLDPASQLRGPDAVAAVLAQLEGFEAPAVAWETAILPARVADYDPAWLDELCRAGRVLWLRLSVAAAGGGTVRHSPIAFVTRRNAAFWRAFAAAVNDPALGREAKQVLVTLRDSGASFFDEIIAATGLLPSQVESALSELAAAGLVSADSFSGLRLLLLPIDRRRPSRHGRRAPIEDAGRWSVIRRPQAADRAAAVEHLARALLRRYGVVCWQALAREGDWLPPWRELAQVLRRLEARGEIRGGRFVAGLSGEQFALPEAVGALRAARREASDALLAFSAADPLNLIGVITPGARIPALAGNRLLLRGGSLAGSAVAGRVEIDPAAGDFNTLRNALLRLPGVTPATRVPRWMRPAPVL